VTDPQPGAEPADQAEQTAALAGRERLSEPVARTGMFGSETTGDTSGYGGLLVRRPPALSSPRPYGSYFDDLADRLSGGLAEAGVEFGDAIERVVAEHGELTFELCTGVSGVHYPADTGRELHAVYHLVSITHNRRLRLEASVPDTDRHLPTMTGVYPTCDWHERETWDFFGLIFDGHPGLTRIEMPDDWKGHPQRKDYPLGGIPVEYRGATVPPPDERRAYQ
jgi:NADH-quinone oxidoreductase subunit C